MHVGLGILRMDKVVISHNPQFGFLSHAPDLNLSAHTAPIIQPQERFPFASGQKVLNHVWQFYQANLVLVAYVLRISCICAGPSEPRLGSYAGEHNKVQICKRIHNS